MRDVLAAFVDRHVELGRFCEMLENDEKPIMIVWGDDGIGKSSFLARLIHECASRKLRKAEVFASKNRFNSYLEILRKIRDDLGPELFPNFTQLVNYLYPGPLQARTPIKLDVGGGAQSVLERARLENVTIHGDVAGEAYESERQAILGTTKRNFSGYEAGFELQFGDMRGAVTFYSFPNAVSVPGFSRGQVTAGFAIKSDVLTPGK